MLAKDFHLEYDVYKYQKRMNELNRERQEVVQNIKSLVRHKRFMNQNNKQHSLQGQQLHKSIKVNDEEPQIQSQKSMNSQHSHLDTHQQEIKKVVEIQSAIKDRNKRLFGGLNIHLKKAQSSLQSEANKVKSKITIEQKVQQRQKEQTQLFSQQKRKEIQQNLEKLTLKKESNSKEMVKTENIILKNKFIAYVSDLQHFLFTKTQPIIAWKPAISNQQLTALKSNTYKHLKAIAEQTVEQITSYNQTFEFTTYRLQNERQYYRNFLDNYFKQKTNFIMTKVQPSISWSPNTMTQKFKQALQASKLMIQSELQVITDQNETYYKQFQKEKILIEEPDQSEQSFLE